MAIITKSIARYTKVGDKTSPKVNYLTQLALGYADIDEVARKVARVTSQAEGDVLAVCRELTYQIADILKSGRSVRLGKLGSFQTRVSSTPTADAETRALAGTNLKGVRVGFYAGTLLRSEMASATFQSIEQLNTTPSSGTADPGSGSDSGSDSGSGGSSGGGSSDSGSGGGMPDYE